MAVQRTNWISLRDAPRLIMGRGLNGERLLQLLDRPILFRSPEVENAITAAEEIFMAAAESGTVQGDGFHQDTRARSAISTREWQSRHIDFANDRLVNPMRGTRRDYPWITSVEVAETDILKCRGVETRPTRGCPSSYNWDAYRAVAFYLLDYHGGVSRDDPELNSQAKLIGKILERCPEKGLPKPSESSFKSHINPWIREWELGKDTKPIPDRS